MSEAHTGQGTQDQTSQGTSQTQDQSVASSSDLEKQLRAARAELEKAQKELAKVKDEAGGRRIENKDLQAELQKLKEKVDSSTEGSDSRVKALEDTLASIQAENRRLKLEGLMKETGLPTALMEVMDLSKVDPDKEEAAATLQELAKVLKVPAQSSKVVNPPAKGEELTLEDWKKLPPAQRLETIDKIAAVTPRDQIL